MNVTITTVPSKVVNLYLNLSITCFFENRDEVSAIRAERDPIDKVKLLLTENKLSTEDELKVHFQTALYLLLLSVLLPTSKAYIIPFLTSSLTLFSLSFSFDENKIGN